MLATSIRLTRTAARCGFFVQEILTKYRHYHHHPLPILIAIICVHHPLALCHDRLEELRNNNVRISLISMLDRIFDKCEEAPQFIEYASADAFR